MRAPNRDGEVVRAEIEVEEAVGKDDERTSATEERFRRLSARGRDIEVVGRGGRVQKSPPSDGSTCDAS